MSSTQPDSDRLDEALEILEGSSPDFDNGFNNHAPMTVEALVQLGRAEAVPQWTHWFLRALSPAEPSPVEVGVQSWRRALGQPALFSAWVRFFQGEVSAGPWQDVLATWCDRLAPGSECRLLHGPIRTAHAARGLATRDSPWRRRELAEGLAFWATYYHELPRAGSELPPVPPSEAARRLQLMRLAHGTSFQSTVDEVVRSASFAPVIDYLDVSPEPLGVLSELTETFAGLYVANARSEMSVKDMVGLLHIVTGSSAVRLLAPFVTADTTRRLLRYTWQAAASILLAFGGRPAAPTDEGPELRPDDWIDRAIATTEEHAIKLTDACLREYEVNPKRVYAAAIEHALQWLERNPTQKWGP